MQPLNRKSSGLKLVRTIIENRHAGDKSHLLT